MKPMSLPTHNRGMALVIALVFLIMITLISVAAMRSSTLELQMASNEQERARALASAQAAIDGVIDSATFTVFNEGATTCFNATGADCTTTGTLTDTAAYSSATNKVKVKLLTTGTLSCRSCGTSGAKFEGSIFSINSVYDDSTDSGVSTRGGRADVTQGYVVLVPKSGS